MKFFLSWQKILNINICDWNQLNTKYLFNELNDVNKWTQHKHYKVQSSMNYLELIDKIKNTQINERKYFPINYFNS